MIEMLINVNPSLYNECIRYLKPLIYDSETRYNFAHGSYGVRFFHPDGATIGGTRYSYNSYYPIGSEESFLTGKSFFIATGETYVYMGWYIDTDLGKEGYVRVVKNGVEKRFLLADMIYNIENPKHLFIDRQNFMIFYENEAADFRIMNMSNRDVSGNIMPILYRITSKTRINDNGMQLTELDLKHTPPIIGKQQNVPNHLLSKLENYIDKMERQNRPVEMVNIKQENGSEKQEMRSKLDPYYQEWVETLHNIEVCDFCGAEIKREASSNYCYYCGVKLKDKKKKKPKNEGAWEEITRALYNRQNK